MSTQSLLGDLEGALGVLEGTGLEELDDSLLVGRHATDLGHYLPDKFDAFAETSLLGGLRGAVGTFAGGLVLRDLVPLVLSDGDDSRVGFHHNNIILIIDI